VVSKTKTRAMHSPKNRRPKKRRGLTLLELLLALSLSGIVMYAISFAVHLHLRALDVRRTDVEEARLARSILQMIANDIRSTIVAHEVDFSGVQGMIDSAAKAAATDVAAALAEAGGDTGGGDTGGGDTGGGGTGGGGTGGGDTGGGGGTDDTEIPDESLDDGEPGSSNTVDLAAATTLPAEPGLFGNQYQLQVDVSRVPRPDEYLAFYNNAPDSQSPLTDLPSDVKTVTYYLQMAGGQGVQDDFSTGQQQVAKSGLVRRSLDRQVTQFAAYNGSATELFQTGEFLGAEVVQIEFQYFDGTQLVAEWDSIEMGGLPLAVQVTLVIRPALPVSPNSAQFNATQANDLTSQGYLVYQMLVHLPLGKLIDQEALLAEQLADEEAAGTSE
jgi:prepilin-type N-terminal cleavage/methylation domain-containing protein